MKDWQKAVAALVVSVAAIAAVTSTARAFDCSRETVAAHEARHAVVAWLLPEAKTMAFEYVAIVTGAECTAGETKLSMDGGNLDKRSLTELYAIVAIGVAGANSTDLRDHPTDSGFVRRAAMLIAQKTMVSEHPPDYDDAAQRTIDHGLEQAHAVLNARKYDTQKIAERIMANGRLGPQDLEEVLGPRPR